jgi:3-deoxy-D-manno-octulosonic-acid transferase
VRSILWILFWFIYFPLIRLMCLFFFWHRRLEERERFEKKNKFEMLAHSFSEILVKADLCFQFASEGEFQQVLPLITDSLKSGKKIELVFFSPSVEKSVMQLAASYRSQIRYLRFPLVRLSPGFPNRCFSHWVTASTLIMVRYDFFPEFLLWGTKKKNHLKIVWMSFKKERLKNKRPSLWKRFFLMVAKTVVYASEEDLHLGYSLGYPGKFYDFRIEQIRRRIQRREQKFEESFILHSQLIKVLDSFPKKILIGNSWPSDLFLLSKLPSSVAVLIVPHKLDVKVLDQFYQGLINLGRNPVILDDQTQSIDPCGTYILNKKGILCELYADFKWAYVGGGFEGSIHSVLEPLVAGSSKIACGPAHHRSTEYDVCKDLEQISEVSSPELFLEWLNDEPISLDHAKIVLLLKDYAKLREFVIPC